MPELIPFAVDRADVTSYYEALAAALDGQGPALAPYAAGQQAPEVPQEPQDAPEDLALVIATSGSTGVPKRAMLTRQALLASALATHDRLGGPGTWLLPLPPEHIAGTQVLVRSIVAGTTPIVMDSWSVEMFIKASTLVSRNAPPFSATYTSLVPTQLHDVLESPDAVRAARRYRGILIGGASTPTPLREAAVEAGLAIRTTYGSSETAGGCVYDGRPLEGVEIELLDEEPGGRGRVALGGPTIAAGYLEQPELSRAHFVELGHRVFFRTDDLGELHDGVLTVTGRADEVIVTGGYKVSPHVVEDAVRSVPGVQDVICLGLPDERWGQVVAIAVVPQDSHASQQSAGSLPRDIHDVCLDALPPYAVPRRIAMFKRLPTRGIGKPDRAAIAGYEDWRSLQPADESRLTED